MKLPRPLPVPRASAPVRLLLFYRLPLSHLSSFPAGLPQLSLRLPSHLLELFCVAYILSGGRFSLLPPLLPMPRFPRVLPRLDTFAVVVVVAASFFLLFSLPARCFAFYFAAGAPESHHEEEEQGVTRARGRTPSQAKRLARRAAAAIHIGRDPSRLRSVTATPRILSKRTFSL